MIEPAVADDRGNPGIAASISAAFGARRAIAERYADILTTDGITRGVLGPREAPRVWERHLLNSVALAGLIRPGARVVDLGSGAGLPGIPLAIARPDLEVVLLEPLLRRVSFLRECLERLSLSSVEVQHGRAEEGLVPLADYVVVRAVAPLDRLVTLCRKMLIDNGVLLALKGTSASGEVDQVRRTMRIDSEVLTVTAPGHDATVVRAVLAATPASPEGRGTRRRTR